MTSHFPHWIKNPETGQIELAEKVQCPVCYDPKKPMKIAAIGCKACREKGTVIATDQWMRPMHLKPDQQVTPYEKREVPRKAG